MKCIYATNVFTVYEKHVQNIKKKKIIQYKGTKDFDRNFHKEDM